MNRKESRMFTLEGKRLPTWNPVTGCLYMCKYCWARKMATTKLRHTRKYRLGFKPQIHMHEFKRKFKKGELYFVSDMGDLFGSWVPSEWIVKVLKHIERFPGTRFLFLTKNPARYFEFIDVFPRNVVLGATIETDRDTIYVGHGVSRAPLPTSRLRAMGKLEWKHKLISIEPILKFNLKRMVEWMITINPEIIYIGYDNYGNKLPEPALNDTLKLIDCLETHGFTVIVKTLRRAWWEK